MSVLATILGLCVLCTLAVLAIALSRCTNVQVTAFVWPTLVRCAAPPAALVMVVDQLLQRDGSEAEAVSADVTTMLEELARELGGEAVACALHETVVHPRSPDRAARAARFLREHFISISDPPEAA